MFHVKHLLKWTSLAGVIAACRNILINSNGRPDVQETSGGDSGLRPSGHAALSDISQITTCEGGRRQERRPSQRRNLLYPRPAG